MITLASNGPSLEPGIWHGVDGREILYPAVSTCITVSCVAGDKIIGIHLFYHNQAEKTELDLATFAREVKEQGADVKSVYIVGMLTRSWQAAQKNWTGLFADDGTLYTAIRRHLGYQLAMGIYDTSADGPELNIKATKVQGSISYTYTGSDDRTVNILPASFELDV
ncbi:hypothetical protein A9Q81_22285 [Gammaproteobacteria bacterium 42_54_T18]|nr:hypothetical protein A9Q81_22285 [Gammaproteobacteria bacterium 42_54_T18]